jgi:hypothetical protein
VSPQEKAYSDLVLELAEVKARLANVERTIKLLRDYNDFFWSVVFDVAGQIVKLTDLVHRR